MKDDLIYSFVENYITARCTGAVVVRARSMYVSPTMGPVVTVFIPTGEMYAGNRPLVRSLAAEDSDVTYQYRLNPPGSRPCGLPCARIRLLPERLPGWAAFAKAANKQNWLRMPRVPIGGSIPGNCCPVCFSLRLAKAVDVNGTAGTRCVSCGWSEKGPT